MGASVQVFRQLCIMLLYMLVGYTLYKKKSSPKQAVKNWPLCW